MFIVRIKSDTTLYPSVDWYKYLLNIYVDITTREIGNYNGRFQSTARRCLGALVYGGAMVRVKIRAKDV